MFSKRALEIQPFTVMEILSRAKKLEEDGEKVIHLEIGEPDFPTPGEVVEEACRAMREGDTHYTDSRGVPELREAISKHLKESISTNINHQREILITGGVSQGLEYVLASLVDPGDQVIIQDPGYPCYPNFIRFFDGIPVPVPGDRDHNPDLEKLKERINRKTKAILITTPNNPTGTYFDRKTLRGLADIAEDNHIWLISDEIYSGLTYDAPRSPSVLEMDCECYAMLDGFSKLYAMTGWRLGYTVAPEVLTEQMLKLQQNFFISPSSFAQRAGVVALAQKERIKAMKAEFDRRRRFILKRIEEIPEMEVNEPKGAYYVFPDLTGVTKKSTLLANHLLENAKVAVTPGVAFGARGEGHIRISYANSMENLEEGMARIENAIKDYEE